MESTFWALGQIGAKRTFTTWILEHPQNIIVHILFIIPRSFSCSPFNKWLDCTVCTLEMYGNPKSVWLTWHSHSWLSKDDPYMSKYCTPSLLFTVSPSKHLPSRMRIYPLWFIEQAVNSCFWNMKGFLTYVDYGYHMAALHRQTLYLTVTVVLVLVLAHDVQTDSCFCLCSSMEISITTVMSTVLKLSFLSGH